MRITNPNKQNVGELIDGVYHIDKYIQHFMFVFQGFGLSLTPTMEQLVSGNCKHVMINFHVPTSTHPRYKDLPLHLQRAGAVIKLKSPFSLWTGSKNIKTFMKGDPQCFVGVDVMEKL